MLNVEWLIITAAIKEVKGRVQGFKGPRVQGTAVIITAATIYVKVVIPVQTGVQPLFVIPCTRSTTRNPVLFFWIPAFAGMTKECRNDGGA